MSIAKTLPELTAYIESRIRALGRTNDVYDWSDCIDLYAHKIGESREMINRVLEARDRPTRAILYSLIGHMGIVSVYETSAVVQCDKCKRSHKDYYYVIKTESRD